MGVAQAAVQFELAAGVSVLCRVLEHEVVLEILLIARDDLDPAAVVEAVEQTVLEGHHGAIVVDLPDELVQADNLAQLVALEDDVLGPEVAQVDVGLQFALVDVVERQFLKLAVGRVDYLLLKVAHLPYVLADSLEKLFRKPT